MSASIDYNQHPEVIELCCNCRKITCEQGRCNELMEKIYELKNKPVPRRIRPSSGKGRHVLTYTINGVENTMRQWCQIYGIKYDTVYARIAAGRTLEQALTDPIDESKRPRKRKAKNKA